MNDKIKKRLAAVTLVLVVIALAFYGCDKPKESEFEVRSVERGGLLCSSESGNCVESWNGADVVVYSDEGSTQTILLDGATGNFDIEGDLDVNGTANIDAIDIDGAFSISNTFKLEGAADAVQLSVTGYTTQTSDLVNFNGGMVDIGECTAGVADGDNDLCVAAVLEVDGELEADGAIDADAGLTVDGALTDIGGGTYGTADGDNDVGVAGDLEVEGSVVLANGTFPLEYATAGYQLVFGTETMTATQIVATGLTTVTWALCTLGVDVDTDAGDPVVCTVDVSANVVTVKLWQDDWTAAATASQTVHWMAIGLP